MTPTEAARILGIAGGRSRSPAKQAASRENGGTRRYTYTKGTLAYTKSDRYWVEMPDQFDRREDFDNPKSWRGLVHDPITGRATGRRVQVRVDHDATGSGTTGTGETIVRVI